MPSADNRSRIHKDMHVSCVLCVPYIYGYYILTYTKCLSRLKNHKIIIDSRLTCTRHDEKKKSNMLKRDKNQIAGTI